MKFSELKKMWLENGGATGALRAASSSPPGKSSTTKTPSVDSKLQEEISELCKNLGGLSVEQRQRHCRGCSHLRVFRMPTAASAGGKWLQADVVSKEGKHATVPVEKLAGKLVAVCKNHNWGEGYVAAPHQILDQGGYFLDQGQHCADYEEETNQCAELRKLVDSE